MRKLIPWTILSILLLIALGYGFLHRPPAQSLSVESRVLRAYLDRMTYPAAQRFVDGSHFRADSVFDGLGSYWLEVHHIIDGPVDPVDIIKSRDIAVWELRPLPVQENVAHKLLCIGIAWDCAPHPVCFYCFISTRI